MNDNYIPKHASFNDISKLNLDKINTDESFEKININKNENAQTNGINKQKIKDIPSKTVEPIKDEKNNTNLSKNTKQKDKKNIKTKINEFSQQNKTNQKKKRRLKRHVKKLLWFLMLIIFIITFIISVSQILKWNEDNKETSKIIENIQNDVNIVEIQDNENTELVNEETVEETSDYWYYTKFSLIDVDINKLKEKNSDTVGWININNTNVNYPYVHYTDNEFYLNHSYDRTYNDAGWVFMDYRNNSNLDNKNTILYAHSRLDDSMFGSLSETLKSKWYQNKDNHIIRISTETENSLWQIFSIYNIEEEAYYITTDFGTDEEYQTYLNTIKKRSIYNFDASLTINDKILTLSTCYSDTIRTVIHAKLIKKSIK